MRHDGAIVLPGPMPGNPMMRRRVPRAAMIAVGSWAIFALLLSIAGKDPLRACHDTLVYVFGNAYGFSELLVRMTPLLLTAVAVALPARLGLINVGGEGQLYMGAWLATAGALAFPGWPAWLLLPLLTVLGFIGGALWALLPGVLRAAKLVNETISTLLLNYVAPLIVSFFIFGPWRSAESASYPESDAFVDAARLPSFGGTRVHAGLLFGLFIAGLYSVVMRRTRWGLEMRAIGGNPEASARLGIPVPEYMIAAMAVAGGIAGLAGMAEVSAIQGRLVAGLSPGYGFMGFLVAWLAGNSAIGIVVMALLFAAISSFGDILQITQGVPYAVVNVLMAVILFIVLGRRRPAGRAGS
jgi:general nucleoside transport system permease protein